MGDELGNKCLKYYADFLIICGLLLFLGIGGSILYQLIYGGGQ